MAEAVVVQGLSKRFHRYNDTDRPSTLKETILRGRWRRTRGEDFWALRDVSFTVTRGRMVGVIGRNGAGKSTLLRLIGKVGRPDRGKVTAHGRIGALLDLGSGFHPDLTGRDNVFINGVVGGLTRAEVAARFESIVAFAELEEFIDNPMRTYSTGMQMRLSFAVAIHSDPEILLIDEVLSVGDLAFQRKCLERIAQLKAGGCAIMFVSHDGNAVRRLCEDAIWLADGQLVGHGPAAVVVAEYESQTTLQTRRQTPLAAPAHTTPSGIELRMNDNRFGSLELQITDVRLVDRAGFPAKRIDAGDSLRVEVEYLAPRRILLPIFGVSVCREDQFVCCETSTEAAGVAITSVEGRGRVALQFERLDLARGHYFIDVGIYEAEWAYAYDYHWRAYPLTVESPPSGKGLLHSPHHWEIDGSVNGLGEASCAPVSSPSRCDAEAEESEGPNNTRGAAGASDASVRSG